MAVRKKTPPPEAEELDELEELDEDLTEATDSDDAGEGDEGGETLTAKEAALKLKVDARTFRKFLRSKFGKVGQGNRWAIDASEFEELKAQFEAWHKPKAAKEDKPADDAGEELQNMAEEANEVDDEFDDLEELEEV